jgi:Ca2+-dependent lipid-binding protein
MPNTLSPIWNEMLFFTLKNVAQEDLDSAELNLSCFDYNTIGSNATIGMFNVDLSYLYKMNKNHELYRRWVPLMDPDDSE